MSAGVLPAMARSIPLLEEAGAGAGRAAAWVAIACGVGAVAASVVTDVRSRRILNVVTLPALSAILLCQVAAGGPAFLGRALLGVLVCAGPFLLASVPGWIGMGDVKLLAAVGALLGPRGAVAAVFWVAVAGGLEAVLALAGARLRGAARPSHVPYACAIGAGSLLAVLYGLPGP